MTIIKSKLLGLALDTNERIPYTRYYYYTVDIDCTMLGHRMVLKKLLNFK